MAMREGLGRGVPAFSASYDLWRGELRLHDPEPLPLDVEIGRWLAAGSDPVVDASTGYTLLAFARRSAVFAMREASIAAIRDGLRACAYASQPAIDERDVLLAVAMLHHATRTADVDAAAVLRESAGTGPAEFRELVDGFLIRPAGRHDLRDAWGHVEVDTPHGPGLLQWGFKPWAPALHLEGAAIHIASGISEGDYQADDPMLATELPDVWLRGSEDPALGSILGSALGTASIHGRLRPQAGLDHASQQLTIWVMETPDGPSALKLLAMAEHGRPETAMVGVADGALFALAIARSYVAGVSAHESTRTLGRFGPLLAEALAQASERKP